MCNLLNLNESKVENNVLEKTYILCVQYIGWAVLSTLGATMIVRRGYPEHILGYSVEYIVPNNILWSPPLY